MKNDPPSHDIRQQHLQQSPSVPVSDQINVSTEHGEKCNRQQENEISSLKKRVNLWVALLPSLMFIIAAAGVSVTYFQLDSARSQFQQDQRPYVISLAKPRLFAPNQLIMVDFLNGNYGKSPAIKAGGGGKVFFGDDALGQADRWFNEEAPRVFSRRYETILPPNTPASHIEARRTTVISDRPISAEEFGLLMRKDFSIVAVMRQVYLDGVGNQYWTDSCVSNLAGGEMAVVECNTHNEIRY